MRIWILLSKICKTEDFKKDKKDCSKLETLALVQIYVPVIFKNKITISTNFLAFCVVLFLKLFQKPI